MNRFLWILPVLAVIAGTGCQSAPATLVSSGVMDKELKLIDVRINNKSIGLNRDTLAIEGFGEIFTLTFGSDRLSGVAAPNRYFAPYTLGSNQSITVSNVAGTLMAPIREPDKLKESEFLSYIENAYKWNMVKNNLELSSKGKDGGEVVLVFSL